MLVFSSARPRIHSQFSHSLSLFCLVALTFPSCDSAFSIFILVAFSRRFRFPRNGDISNVSAIQRQAWTTPK
nr:hypothetical protein FVER53263_21059 [Fusarium verticillioides]